mmetsp:Transcript_6455/g.19394  ORF Transcript_6455/g.19394 Transcript_6455/m.19394 type:complete len:390 (-) Transcript_6455:2323-3492(-)
MRDHAISLHFSKPQPAVARSALHGLPREDLRGPARARVNLVVHHMLESLVVRRVHEDHGVELAARVAVVHALVASALVAHLLERLGHVVHRHVGERRGVALLAVDSRHLGQQRLDQMPNRHAARDGVRVDDDIRRHTLNREGHVLLSIRHADGALLPVARRELVADLWDADGADARLDEALARIVGGEHHLVHHARRGGRQRRRAVALGIALWPPVLGRHRCRLADDDVLARHARARRRDAVCVKLLVLRRLPHARRVIPLRPLNHLAAQRARALFLVPVRSVVHRAHEAAVDRALVHDDTILLVVARVHHDGHDGVLARRQLAEVQEFHRSRGDQRLLRVVQDVALRLEAQVEVGGKDAHRLLAHCRLVHVARRLVVIGEGHDRAAHA